MVIHAIIISNKKKKDDFSIIVSGQLPFTVKKYEFIYHCLLSYKFQMDKIAL